MNAPKGVYLEEPNDHLQNLFEEAVSEVETFTGKEFVEIPEFKVVSEDSTRIPAEEGIYFEDSNSIIYNPQGQTSKSQGLEEGEWEVWNTYLRGVQQIDEKDVILEEVGHALQDQQTEATNFNRSGNYFIKRKLGMESIPDLPEEYTEGFMDFMVSYLGNRELETTQAELMVNANIKLQEDQQKSALSKIMPSQQSDLADRGFNHTLNRYVGHLYFKALSEEEGLDTALETAFDPQKYVERDQMFETIQSANLDYDETTYRLAKRYEDEGSLEAVIEGL